MLVTVRSLVVAGFLSAGAAFYYGSFAEDFGRANVYLVGMGVFFFLANWVRHSRSKRD
jgi:hypothetical protein